jgi:di/tricarboxylate transporter
LQAILVDNSGVEVLKKRGLKVLRARVTKHSRLVGYTAAEAQFRENYKAAIVAVQQGGKNTVKPLSSLKFGVGDILVLQVSDDCPLLSPPVTTASSDQFGPDENTRPNTTERLDVEVGSKDSDIASSSVVCKIVSICLGGGIIEFSYFFFI